MQTNQKNVIDAFGYTLAHDLFDPRERDEAGRAPLLLEAGTWIGFANQVKLWKAGICLVEIDSKVPFRDHA